MRPFLLIPVLILFLSNVPFVQQISMEGMIPGDRSCSQHKECATYVENPGVSCSMEERGCEGNLPDESTAPGSPESSCCQQTGTTCVCIICFQYSAPINSITEYLFNYSSQARSIQAYLIDHIQDPHIAAPWQPPDIV